MSDEGETAKLHTRVGNLRNDLNAHLVECARATAELLAAIEKNTEASERLGAQIDALSLEMDNRFAGMKFAMDKRRGGRWQVATNIILGITAVAAVLTALTVIMG